MKPPNLADMRDKMAAQRAQMEARREESQLKVEGLMLKVHREGIGICGVYPRDVATTKVQQVAAYSRKHQHPLQCVMEET